MEYAKIGTTDLEVSRISLGSWVFGGENWGGTEDDISERVVKEAVENGVNLIDTAPFYGFGRAEEVIGKAIKKVSRDKVIIATKCGLEKKEHAVRPNLSAAFIREEVENSLRRLNVETIDLYQCHWPDPNTSLRETFGEMKKLVKEGKIRFIGVCNFGKDLVEKALNFAPIVTNQVRYSIFDTEIEKELMPFCAEKGVSILAYGALGGGILTGKYKAPQAFPRGDARDLFYKFYSESFWPKAKEIIASLEETAQKHNAPVSQAAINWVLHREEVASCIVGCRTPEQLCQNIGAADWVLCAEDIATLQPE